MRDARATVLLQRNPPTSTRETDALAPELDSPPGFAVADESVGKGGWRILRNKPVGQRLRSMERYALGVFVSLMIPAQILLNVVAGGIGLWRLRRREARTGAAIAGLTLAGLIGFAAAAVVEVLVAELSSFDTVVSPDHYVRAAPAAAAAGARVFLARVAGLAVGQLRGRAWGIVGSVMGPILCVASVAVVSVLYNEATLRLHALEVAEVAELQARSDDLAAEVVAVAVALDSDVEPVVTRLDLRIVLTSAQSLELEAGKARWPQFTASAPGALPLSSEAPAGSPDELPPATPAEYG